MKQTFFFCLLMLSLSFDASANSPPPWDAKTLCLVMSYDVYIKAQQRAAIESAALSAKYIPESAQMAESQKNLRLLETQAEKSAFIYLAEKKPTQIPVEKPISAWLEAFDTNDMTTLTAQSAGYAEVLEKLKAARAESLKVVEAWQKNETVKTPHDLVGYQNDLLAVGRELNLKTRKAETHCATK